MKKLCALGCGHRVGQGDRHAKFHCPPKAGGRTKRRYTPTSNTVTSNDGRATFTRGEAVKGTGKPKGKQT